MTDKTPINFEDFPFSVHTPERTEKGHLIRVKDSQKILYVEGTVEIATGRFGLELRIEPELGQNLSEERFFASVLEMEELMRSLCGEYGTYYSCVRSVSKLALMMAEVTGVQVESRKKLFSRLSKNCTVLKIVGEGRSKVVPNHEIRVGTYHAKVMLSVQDITVRKNAKGMTVAGTNLFVKSLLLEEMLNNDE